MTILENVLSLETQFVACGNLFPSVIASEQDERGKTRRSRSFFSNLKGIANGVRNAQLAIQWDYHEFATFFLSLQILTLTIILVRFCLTH